MPIRSLYELTDPRQFFAEPATPRQRQYEALRAYFVERLASAEAARRFGYSPGAFRVLCHTFRRGELPDFFTTAHPGPREQPKKSAAQKQIVALRKRNYSVYEISQALKEQGTPLSATAVREVLAAEGFAPLPRRLDEERPGRVGPSAEAVANVGDFTLSSREFTTRVGGLFLFIADLVRIDTDALALAAKLPGSRMIPAAHALRAALALKLWSIERKSHVMALVADEGLALFCGLNAMPKKSFLSEYSSRITRQTVSRLLASWHTRFAGDALFTGEFSTSISTPCRISASIPSSNPIIWRSEVAGRPHARLRRRPGPPNLSRSRRHARRCRRYTGRSQGALPSPRPSSYRARIRAHRQTRHSPVVARPIPAPRPIAPNPSALAQFRSVEIQARAFSGEVETGSPKKMRSLKDKQERIPFLLERNSL